MVIRTTRRQDYPREKTLRTSVEPQPVAATDEPGEAKENEVLAVEPAANCSRETPLPSRSQPEGTRPVLLNLTKDEAIVEAGRFGFQNLK